MGKETDRFYVVVRRDDGKYLIEDTVDGGFVERNGHNWGRKGPGVENYCTFDFKFTAVTACERLEKRRIKRGRPVSYTQVYP